MKRNFIALIALVVGITALGVDPGHGRRIRFSFPVAKAAPTPTVKPAPVAAAARKSDAPASGGLVIVPGISIRPGSGSGNAPVSAMAPVNGDLGDVGDPFDVLAQPAVTAPASEAKAPSVSPPKEAVVQPPPPPPQRHFVELNPAPRALQTPPAPQRDVAPLAARQTVLCFKSAAGKCSTIE